MSEDEELAQLTRKLIKSIADFKSMLAIDAPRPLLSRQVDEMSTLFEQIDKLTGDTLLGGEQDIWALASSKMMTLYDLVQARQT